MAMKLADHILSRMKEKTTEELLSIWIEHDLVEWSSDAFDAIRQVLTERGVAVPKQKDQKVEDHPKSEETIVHKNPSLEPEQLVQYEQRYGRRLTAVEAAVVHEWNRAGDKPLSILTYPDIPQKKLDAALMTFASIPSGDSILGLLDRKSGKEGILFTTKGIFWKLGRSSSAKNVRYGELDPEAVTYKHQFDASMIILNRKHQLPFPFESEAHLGALTSFIRAAIAASPSQLPEICWEFCSRVVEGEAQSVKKFWSLEEIKIALTSHQVQTNWLYRKYNPRICADKDSKREWIPFPDDLIHKLGLSKEAVVNTEKKGNRNINIVVITLGVLIVVGVAVAVWLLIGNVVRGPQSPVAWVGLIGGIIGIVYSVVFWRRIYKYFGILGVFVLIIGLILLMKFCE